MPYRRSSPEEGLADGAETGEVAGTHAPARSDHVDPLVSRQGVGDQKRVGEDDTAVGERQAVGELGDGGADVED